MMISDTIYHMAELSLKFRLVRFFLFLIVFPFIKKIRGLQNLPKEGGFIVASNHSSFFDPLILGVFLSRFLNRYVHFLAYHELFSYPLVKFVIELAESIRVEPKEEAKSLLIAQKYLRDGKTISLFPEGTRSYDGKIKKGKTGAAALALSAKVPVVPVGLINTYKILPRQKLLPRPARCEMNVGEPLKFEPYYEEYDEALNQNDQEIILELQEKVVRIIMKEIARLSNQEYLF